MLFFLLVWGEVKDQYLLIAIRAIYKYANSSFSSYLVSLSPALKLDIARRFVWASKCGSDSSHLQAELLDLVHDPHSSPSATEITDGNHC